MARLRLSGGVALGLLAAAVSWAGPSKAELQGQLADVMKRMQEHNAEGAKKGISGTPAYTNKMLAILKEMTQLNLAIAQASDEDTSDPYAGMSQAELVKAKQRLLDGGGAKFAEGTDAYLVELRRLEQLIQAKKTRETHTEVIHADGSTSFLSVMDVMRFMQAGEIERAMNAYEGLIAPGISSKNSGTAQNAAAAYLDFLGDAERCIEINREILAFTDQQLGPGPYDLRDPRQVIHLGTRSRARQSLARALAELNRFKELESWAAQSATAAAALAAEYAEARPAPRSYNQTSPLFYWLYSPAAGYGLLGDAYHRKGKTAEALIAYGKAFRGLERCLAVLAECSEVDNLFLQNMRNLVTSRLALWRGQAGDFAESLKRWDEYFHGERAYMTRSKSVGGSYRGFVRSMYAEVLFDAGRLEEAAAAAEEASKLYSEQESMYSDFYRAMAWKPLYLAGRIAEARGKPEEAVDQYLKAVKLVEALYAKLRSGQLKGQFLKIDECRDTYRRLIALYLAKGDLDAALEMLERSKSAVLLDMLRGLPLRERRKWPEALLKRERELKRKLRERNRTGPKSSPSKTRSASGADHQAVFQEYEGFLRQVAGTLGEREPAGRAGAAAVMVTDAATLKKAVGKARVVVSYFDDGTDLHALVIGGGVLRRFPAGKSAAALKGVRRMRRRVGSQSKRWRKVGEKLFGDLVAPWRDLLDGAKELVVIPTGELAALPFSALPVDTGGYLSDLVPVSNLSQVTLLTQASPKVKTSSEAPVILADPDGSLPFARTEAAQIQAALGSSWISEIREGEAATEGYLKERAGYLNDAAPPRVLHLATHGLLERGAHLSSSLVLAPDDIEDGALTFGEIFNDLDLRGTEVVVLSACNSGVGKATGGDEVLGLSRAFQYAGAKWVVGSLWEVSDEASAALMARFHAELVKPESAGVDHALAAAQRGLRAEKSEWEHPFFWAPFVAYRR